MIRDLVVDRTALDHIIQAGGYVSVRTGSARESQRHADSQTQRGCGF